MREYRIDYAFDGFALVSALSQAEDLFRYIQLGLGLLATIISLAYTIYKWYIKVKADGKITKDEIKDGLKNLKEHLDDKSKGE